MSTRVWWWIRPILLWMPALVALFGTYAPASAQQPLEPLDLRLRPPIGISLQLNTSVHDNFFQAAHGQPDTTLRAGAVRIRFSQDWLRSLGGEVYLDGRLTMYEGFEPTYGTGGGLRLGQGVQRLEIGMDYDWWLPRLDVTEEAGRADVGVIRGEYWLRMGKLLELSANGRLRWEGFVGADTDGTRGDSRDHSFLEAGGAARTRIFGRVFSPEVGLVRGGPKGWDPAQEYEQQDIHFRIRSIPHDRLYIGARYRVRDREYPGAAPDSRNSGREDRREQLTLLLEIEITEAMSGLVYYAQEDGRSSRALRDFRTRLLSVGMTFRKD